MASDDIIRLPVAMTCYRCHRCLFYPPTLSVVLKDWPSETLLPLQTSAQRTLYVYHKRLRPLSSISRHRWKWLKFWVFFICIFWLRWGDWNMKFFVFFSRLPIRTIRNQFVKKLLLFSFITELHWSHWSVLETTDWEKDEWVQCFPLFSVTTHTNNFLGFFCYRTFFVMAADRLLIICL